METWTSRGALEKSPEFKSVMASMPYKDFETAVKERGHRLEQQVNLIQKNIQDSIPENEWSKPGYNSQAWPKMSVSETWENQHLGLDDLSEDFRDEGRDQQYLGSTTRDAAALQIRPRTCGCLGAK